MAHCYKRILVKWYFIVWWQTLFMSVCVHTCTCLLACACLQSKLTKGRWRKRWHHPHRKFHHDLLRCPHRPVGPLCSWEACEQSPPPPPHIYWYIHSKSKCSPEPFYLSWSMQVKVKPSGSKPFWGLLYLLKTWLESLAFHSSYQAWKKVAFFSRLQPVRHPPINNVGESGALKLSAGVFFPCVRRRTGTGARYVGWFLSWPQSRYGSFLGESLWDRGPEFSVVPARSWVLTRYESCCIAGDGKGQTVGDDWWRTHSWN